MRIENRYVKTLAVFLLLQGISLLAYHHLLSAPISQSSDVEVLADAYAQFVRELYAERAAVHEARSAKSAAEFVAQYRA